MKLMNWFYSFLFPPHCAGCGCGVKQEGELCVTCYHQVLHIRKLKSNSLDLSEVWTLSEYSHGIRTIMHDIKFNGKKERAQGAAPFLQEFSLMLPDLWEDFIPDYVIPVPINSKKLHTRGYNQVDLLFKDWVAYQQKLYWIGNRSSNSSGSGHNNDSSTVMSTDSLKWQWLDCLSKSDTTTAMWELTKQDRIRNLSLAYSYKAEGYKNLLKGKQVLLVDDIYTTGATMNIIAKLIKESKVEKIKALTISSGA